MPSELRPNQRWTGVISKRSTPVDFETGIFYAQIAVTHSKRTTLKHIPRKPAMIRSAGVAFAVVLYCSTSFQGYRICQDSQGYRSTEWDRDGTRYGQDSDGRRWTTSGGKGSRRRRSTSRQGADVFPGRARTAFSPSRWYGAPADAETAVHNRNDFRHSS